MVLEPESGQALVSVAGAEPPLVLQADGSALPVAVQGSLLGIDHEGKYASASFRLAPGDTLILVTDGITEARQGTEFLDYDGLVRLAQEAPRNTPSEVGRFILEGARSFTGNSLAGDACLLLARLTS